MKDLVKCVLYLLQVFLIEVLKLLLLDIYVLVEFNENQVQ